MSKSSDVTPRFQTAVILKFPRRRGRPRTEPRMHDTGTPELVMKRLKNETAETLDLCFERDLITREQHWCGIHLRWLYTLRHGAPSVRAVDPTHFGGLELRPDDPEWRQARELEYHEAIRKLSASGHSVLLLNICVHNERPAFLFPRKMNNANAYRNSLMIDLLREGLDVLATLWKR